MRRTRSDALGSRAGAASSGEGGASYVDMVLGPLGEGETLGALARMPGAAAVRRLLREGTPGPLAPPGRDRMFVDEPDRVWAWPGAEELGVVLLLDPWPLSPLRARGGGYIVDARALPPPERTIYAPDAACASIAAECDTFAEARARMPQDWPARIDEALARVDRYVREVEALRPALDALDALAPAEREARLAEHGLAAEDVARPIFASPRDRRERLRELARAAGWLASEGAA